MVRLEQPHDEMPAGVRAAPQRGFARDTSPEAQRLRAKKGGRGKAAWRAATDPFQKYLDKAGPEAKALLKAAHDLAKTEMATVARDVGGGVCSVGPSTIIMGACLAYTVFMDEMCSGIIAGDAARSSRALKLGDHYRLGIQTARALAASEAKSKPLQSGNMAADLALALSGGGVKAPKNLPLRLNEPPEPPLVDVQGEPDP